MAADFSSDMPCCSELSELDCTTSPWSAANGAFPLSCEGCRNMCQMWCLFISQTDRAMFENLPPLSGVSPYLLNESLQKFTSCAEPPSHFIRLFRIHSGHIPLPSSPWGQDLIQSVHMKLSWKFSVASCYSTATGSVPALVRQATPMEGGSWYKG